MTAEERAFNAERRRHADGEGVCSECGLPIVSEYRAPISLCHCEEED
jgi:hypothetical protein